MIWQDIVIAIANIFFTYSLVYQVHYGFKKKKGLMTLTTSFLSFVGLYAMALAFVTMNLFYSATMIFINGTMWFVLFLQRLKYERV